MFEYKIVDWDIKDDEDLTAKLNDLGAEGWEIIKLEGRSYPTGTLDKDNQPVMKLVAHCLFKRAKNVTLTVPEEPEAIPSK